MRMLVWVSIGINLLSCGVNEREINMCEQKIENVLANNSDYQFSSDSYRIGWKVLKEEVYFPKLTVLLIEFENASTTTLDFKLLSDTLYERLDNHFQIDDELKTEALPLAIAISKECELIGFDEIVFEFVKYRNSSDYPMYRFICHYPLEQLNQE